MKRAMCFILIMFLSLMTLACRNEDEGNYNKSTEVSEVTISEEKENDNELEKVEEYSSVTKNSMLDLKSTINKDSSTVDVILKNIDEDENTIWQRQWTDLPLTQFGSNSLYEIFEERIYIEVSGKLYCINRWTGEDIYESIIIGSSKKPIVDGSGNVYIHSFLGALITKVSYDGEILWQINDDINSIFVKSYFLDGDYLYISFNSPDISAYNYAQLDKELGKISRFFWNENDSIIWESVKASSTLDTYYLESILDNDIATAWVEGSGSNGIGEWIMFESNKENDIEKIKIHNGYHKSYDLYKENSRIKKMKLTASNGEFIVLEIKDEFIEQEFIFEKAFKTKSLKIEILDIYKGNKYDDMAISSISFY